MAVDADGVCETCCALSDECVCDWWRVERREPDDAEVEAWQNARAADREVDMRNVFHTFNPTRSAQQMPRERARYLDPVLQEKVAIRRADPHDLLSEARAARMRKDRELARECYHGVLASRHEQLHPLAWLGLAVCAARELDAETARAYRDLAARADIAQRYLDVVDAEIARGDLGF